MNNKELFELLSNLHSISKDELLWGFVIYKIIDEYGNELQKTPIAQTGAGQIVISSSNLSTGIYSYSLTIDGNLINTKRMVKVK
jgi:hypothetical protein